MKLNFFHVIGIIMIVAGSIMYIFDGEILSCLYIILLGLCMFEVWGKVFE